MSEHTSVLQLDTALNRRIASSACMPKLFTKASLASITGAVPSSFLLVGDFYKSVDISYSVKRRGKLDGFGVHYIIQERSPS